MGTPNFANLVRVAEGWKKPGAEIRGIPAMEPVRLVNTRIFTVQFSSFNAENPFNATQANDGTTGIPAVGSPWGAAEPGLVCMRVRTLDPQNWFVYRVLCEYGGQNSPLSQLPILREGGQEHEEEIGYDAMGKLYQNTNGQRLTGYTRPFSDQVWTLTRNEATDMFVGSGDWRGVVNSDTVVLGSQSWAAKKVLIRNITSPRQVYAAGMTIWSSKITGITVASGVYTVAIVPGIIVLPGSTITVGDGAGNSLAGTVASSSVTALVMAGSGLTVTGDPTVIPSGTPISMTYSGSGLTYFWPVTYELVIRTHKVAFNGNPSADIGWQQLVENHGSAYRETSGGPLRSSLKYLGLPDVLLHEDGTLWDITAGDTASTLYYLLFDRFPTVTFATLGLSV
jgi:hypothetical protein